MLIFGRATLRLTCQVCPFTADAVPGLFFPLVFSYCVSTQISPTAGTEGLSKASFGLSFPYRALSTASRFATVLPVMRTSTLGLVMSHGAAEV